MVNLTKKIITERGDINQFFGTNSKSSIVTDWKYIIKQKMLNIISINKGDRFFNRNASLGLDNYIGENITDNFLLSALIDLRESLPGLAGADSTISEDSIQILPTEDEYVVRILFEVENNITGEIENINIEFNTQEF